MPEIVFYVGARGEEPVLGYIRDLGRTRAAEAAVIERYIDLLAEHGEKIRMPYARLIDRDHRIFELRPGSHRSPTRFITAGTSCSTPGARRANNLMLVRWRRRAAAS